MHSFWMPTYNRINRSMLWDWGNSLTNGLESHIDIVNGIFCLRIALLCIIHLSSCLGLWNPLSGCCIPLFESLAFHAGVHTSSVFIHVSINTREGFVKCQEQVKCEADVPTVIPVVDWFLVLVYLPLRKLLTYRRFSFSHLWGN